MADKLLDTGGADPAQCWSLTLKVAQFSVAGSNDAQDVEKTMEMGNMCTTERESGEKARATGRNRCLWWKMTFLAMPNVVPATKFNHDQRSKIKFGP